MKTKLAIYTVLVGEKESLNDPLQMIGQNYETDVAIDFFCFTDNLNLISKTWKICFYNHPLVRSEKSSRYPKARPDIFFPDYDYSIYIDNTVVLKRMPKLSDIGDSTFKGFRHPWRSKPIDEADIVVRSGLDDSLIVSEQMKYYEIEKKISDINYLSVGTVLFRKHCDEKVRKFGELWWEQILLYSKRDQLSLDICAKEAGCTMDYFEGDKLSNDLFLWPVVGNGHRILGSFNSKLYAWDNRKDPEAIKNPKKHYLINKIEKNYDKKNSMFSYACDKFESSLNNNNYPKRGLSEIIESAITDRMELKILFVGIESNNIYTVEKEELIKANQVINEYCKYNEKPVVITSQIPEKEIEDKNPYLQAGGEKEFNVIVIMGMHIDKYKYSIKKFIKLLSEGGEIIIQFGEKIELDLIRKSKDEINLINEIEVYHGNNIDGTQIVPNSIIRVKTKN
jgi:hypothetical protein